MKSILAVDDDPAILRVLTQILTVEQGIRLFTAENAVEAKTILDNQAIDLVITDINIPGESGLDLAKFIKANHHRIAIIIFSVISDPDQIRQIMDIGLYGYILKPFDRRQILITIENALRRHDLEMHNWETQQNMKDQLFQKSHQLRKLNFKIGETQATLKSTNSILQEQLIFQQALLEALPHPVFYKALDGVYIGCNSAFESIVERPKDQIIGKTVVDFSKDENFIAQTRWAEKRLMENAETISYESDTTTNNSEFRSFIITKALYNDHYGKPSGIVTSMLDITDRKENEKALKASEKMVRQIMDNLGIGVILIGPNLVIKEMNRQFHAWFNSTNGQEGILCYHLLYGPQQISPCESCSILETFKDGEVRDTVTEITCAGRNCNYRVVTTPIVNSSGRVTSVIAIYEDITKKIVMERELVQNQKLASIGQLAAGVAHEINNPTGFVSSNLKTLDDYQKDLKQLINAYRKLKSIWATIPEEQNIPVVSNHFAEIEKVEQEIDIDYISNDIGQLIAESREGADRIKKIVEDLKRFAHPGQDKVQDTDINAELESTLNIVNNELKYKAKIIKEFGELPIITANPQQLNQVFANLLVNAAQAVSQKGEIKITTVDLGDVIEIRLSDNGCGIPEENLSKIYDPFFTTKEVGKGTGLGMNIVYNIVQKHQGTISVNSKVGQGTTFIIQLPTEQKQTNLQALV